MKIGDAIVKGTKAVTKEYTAYQKKQLKDEARGRHAWDGMMREKVREASIKDVAYSIMEEAYMKASADNTLPAAARQIMYQARPLILEEISKPLGKNFDQYFTQQLLPDYMNDYRIETADWDVVFDARGHLWEPHTGRIIQIGTLDVRAYLRKVVTSEPDEPIDEKIKLALHYPTHGPANRFQNVLFIEKEGFLPLLEHARIAERYDLAIMSTKGVSSTAARSLMENLDSVRFFVLHDFDKAGFSILGTLTRDTRRYIFENPPDVIDLGLRLADVQAEGLPSEPVYIKEKSPHNNLRENGATEEEIDFLIKGRYQGQRVELNAFTSDQFIDWLERKLNQAGVEKIIPNDKETLTDAYRRAVFIQRLNIEIARLQLEMRVEIEDVKLPPGLRAEIKRRFKETPLRKGPNYGQMASFGLTISRKNRLKTPRNPLSLGRRPKI